MDDISFSSWLIFTIIFCAIIFVAARGLELFRKKPKMMSPGDVDVLKN